MRDTACRVHVPPAAASGQALPLLIALHGKGDNGLNFLEGTGLAAAEAIVAAPTGTGLAWAPAPYAHTTLADDTSRINAIIDDICAEHAVDEERIYVCGFSNGGGFAVELSLASERFAGVATVAAAVRASADEIAAAGWPVDYLNIHGTYDDVVPYAGGGPYGVQPAEVVVEGFERRNGAGARAVHRRIEGMYHEWPTGPWAAHRGIDCTQEIRDFFGI